MAGAALFLILAPIVDFILQIVAVTSLGLNIGPVMGQILGRWLLVTIPLFFLPGVFMFIAGSKFQQRQTKGLVIAGCVIGIAGAAIAIVLLLIGISTGALRGAPAVIMVGFV